MFALRGVALCGGCGSLQAWHGRVHLLETEPRQGPRHDEEDRLPLSLHQEPALQLQQGSGRAHRRVQGKVRGLGRPVPRGRPPLLRQRAGRAQVLRVREGVRHQDGDSRSLREERQEEGGKREVPRHSRKARQGVRHQGGHPQPRPGHAGTLPDSRGGVGEDQEPRQPHRLLP